MTPPTSGHEKGQFTSTGLDGVAVACCNACVSAVTHERGWGARLCALHREAPAMLALLRRCPETDPDESTKDFLKRFEMYEYAVRALLQRIDG